MPTVKPKDITRWNYIIQGTGGGPDRRENAPCLIRGFFVAMLAAGGAILLLAESGLPVLARAVVCIGVFLACLVVTRKVCQSARSGKGDSLASRTMTAPPATVSAAPKPASAPKPAPPPAPAPVKAAETVSPGTRPSRLDAPRESGPDDLTLIKGVGPKLAELCHSLGFFHFDQIAAWTGDEVAWVDQNLEGFKGRVTRDEWVAQARILAAGGETEFSARQ